MSVEAGQTLSHYRLIEKIGEGGMGVVWKAIDTTLDREAAIKFLPEGFTADTDRLARLEREAKLLATLNHPYIAAVYGLPNSLHYATSKAAVIGMTRSMARELGRSWIRVNAIAPTAVMTEGTEEFFGERLDKAKQVIAAGQSLQRNLDPDDLVGTVRYLLSDDSKFVTGQTIMVDGGTVML